MAKQQSKHQLFNVPKNLISNTLDYLRKFNYNDEVIDHYDQQTIRYTVTDKNLLHKIRLLCFYSNENIDFNSTNVHYIRYTLDGEYTIEDHDDRCDNSIIFYLNKDDDIKDEFHVENIQIHNDSLWKHGGLIMRNQAKHGGKIYGKGKRDVLCVFY